MFVLRNICGTAVRTNGTKYNIHLFKGASFRFRDHTAKDGHQFHYKQGGYTYSANGAIAPTFRDANIKNIL
jgi:hypothetical protein